MLDWRNQKARWAPCPPSLVLFWNKANRKWPLAVMEADKGDLQRFASRFCSPSLRPLWALVADSFFCTALRRQAAGPLRHDGTWICMQVNWWTMQRNCNGGESPRRGNASRRAASYLGAKRIIPYSERVEHLKNLHYAKIASATVV